MKITVVTPSYNQGRYLEEAILSVLGQGYPDLEYLVMDGGSTDGSAEIIQRYDGDLAYWVSEPDGGQAAAINRGFEKATGDVLCWLNSDDMYLPGTLRYVAERLAEGGSGLLFGNCVHVIEGTGQAKGSNVERWHRVSDLRLHDYVIQPASFWTRETWERVGPLDETLRYSFDWDWYIRAHRAGVRLVPVSRQLAVYRLHADHKTGSRAKAREHELAEVIGRHAGPTYERLFAEMCSRYEWIRAVEHRTRQMRVPELAPVILKLLAPGTFRGFEAQAIRDVSMML